MKVKIENPLKTLIVLIALLLCLTMQTSAQTTGTYGGVTVTTVTNFITVISTGTPTITNVPVAVGGVLFTNPFPIIPPTKTLVITNLVPETNVYAYYAQAQNLLTVNGVTNLMLIGYSTNVYFTAPSTNQTIVPSSTSLYFQLWMSAQLLGPSTNGFFVN